MTRRAAISSALAAAGGAAAFGPSAVGAEPKPRPDELRAATKRYNMKKSINQWAFPYPDRMNLERCLQLAKDAGFDGIELNYDLENDLSPKATTKDYERIRKLADKIGIAISGICSFLYWPYPLTSNDPKERERGMELAGLMTQVAHDLGTENALVVPATLDPSARQANQERPSQGVHQKRDRLFTGVLPPSSRRHHRLARRHRRLRRINQQRENVKAEGSSHHAKLHHKASKEILSEFARLLSTLEWTIFVATFSYHLQKRPYVSSTKQRRWRMDVTKPTGHRSLPSQISRLVRQAHDRISEAMISGMAQAMGLNFNLLDAPTCVREANPDLSSTTLLL